jgi:hypothetical protein
MLGKVFVKKCECVRRVFSVEAPVTGSKFYRGSKPLIATGLRFLYSA